MLKQILLNLITLKLISSCLQIHIGKDKGPDIVIATFNSPPYTGYVIIDSNEDGTSTVSGTVKGFQPHTKHGIHIHQFGDLSHGCLSVGHHYNPTSENHGDLYSQVRHVGDLGNLMANSEGAIHFHMKRVQMQIYGHDGVLGRSFVVHENEDDLGKGTDNSSKNSGNSGERIACAVIGVLNPQTMRRIFD